ncbi:MAG TPA: hypothetical protein VFQ63_02065 [Patescibacteria group bacterium]|nr:hypothetical protein [Patescibacteria group bacterium]
MAERNSQPLVPIDNVTRGETLASSALTPDAARQTATAAEVAGRIFRRTTSKLDASMQDMGYLVAELGLDKDMWQGKIERKIAGLVRENPGLSANDARVNWAAKAEAYLALTKQFGFKEADQYSDLNELSGGLVVALTESGSVVMLGPGTNYNGTGAQGEGRFAMTYMKGREGNKQQDDGLVPPEVHVADGAKEAKVVVLNQDSVWDDAAGEYVTTNWAPVADAPTTNRLLDIDHSKIDKSLMDSQGTSRLLKVMVLAGPEDVEGVMSAFEGVSDEINRLTGTRAVRRSPAAQPAQEE